MDESRLLIGLAAAFAGMTVLMGMVGVVYNPTLLAVAAVFGLVTYLFWTHGTGRLARRHMNQRREAFRMNRERSSIPRETKDEAGGFGSRWERVGQGRQGRRWRQEQWRRQQGRDQQGWDQQRRGQRDHHQQQSNPGGPRATSEKASAGRRYDAETISAYRTLGLEPGADQAAIKEAYREAVKTAHPDTDGGDEETFMAVKDAYERLQES